MIRPAWLPGILALTLMVGCARHYTPNPDVRFDQIPEFTSTNSVSLLNAQSSAEPYPLVLSSRGRYYANRKEWTDVAITVASRELMKRGMTVQAKSDRIIHMSIDSITSEAGTAKIETRIELTVQTGSGYSTTYIGRNNSVLVSVYERQVDGALMRAVAEMLKDPQIVSYLSK